MVFRRNLQLPFSGLKIVCNILYKSEITNVMVQTFKVVFTVLHLIIIDMHIIHSSPEQYNDSNYVCVMYLLFQALKSTDCSRLCSTTICLQALHAKLAAELHIVARL